MILSTFLQQAGFCEVERVGNFNLFKDTSSLVRNGYVISLNMVAKVCSEGKNLPSTSIEIHHKSDPFVGRD
jgi:hypothetical protein